MDLAYFCLIGNDFFSHCHKPPNSLKSTLFYHWFSWTLSINYWHHWQPAKRSATIHFTRWRHQMETFSALLAICAGNSPVTGEFTAQRPVTRSFNVFFDLRLNTRLSKQWWGWWFETLSRPLWRHCNDSFKSHATLWYKPRVLRTTGANAPVGGRPQSMFADEG